MEELIHNGVLVPEYKPVGLSIRVRGNRIALTPEQEEMAVAWVKKLGTDYAKDEIFRRNFFDDFRKALGIDEEISPEEFDFSEVMAYVEREKARRESMSKEEKKKAAAERKAIREANKAKYGYAIVDGMRVEIANYTVEPSSIFIGRGDHPLRGRWKPGPKQEDITLNLSPSAPRPPGNWKEIVWEPDSMWIARWRDKLSGKMKYVWLSDDSILKQKRDIEKYDIAKSLDERIEEVRAHIAKNLKSDDPKRRKLATVCYLIDALKIRVGDEKDKDEADTVGATTLRPEHIKLKPGGVAIFDFLGKDAVRFRKEVKLPKAVEENLREFMTKANSPIFKGIRSEHVSDFLGEVVPGLTAKVFRTYHATKAVEEYLKANEVKPSDPEDLKKFVATMANLQAAIVCNHKRKLPKNWKESLNKKMERLKALRAKGTKRAKEAAKKLAMKIKLMKATKDYNLRTSLKSYIDPRVYYEWGRRVGLDWKAYYPKALQRKFSWVESPEGVQQIDQGIAKGQSVEIEAKTLK
jgi:DNA topoisomerase-1